VIRDNRRTGRIRWARRRQRLGGLRNGPPARRPNATKAADARRTTTTVRVSVPGSSAVGTWRRMRFAPARS